MAEVSIIVPVYNAGRFLRECVGSVVSQSFSDWELVLVDDGSTDDSNAVCREYAAQDCRIRLVEKSNGGLSSARNAGLDVAKARYVTFLDADDELLPGALETMYDIAEREKVALVIGKSIEGIVKPNVGDRGSRHRIYDSRGLCRDMFYRIPHPSMSACGRLYERRLFDGLRFYNGMYEDLEIFHKILLKTDRVAVTDRPVYYYRQNPSSFVNTWSESRRDAVRVTEKIVERYEGDPELRKAAANRRFRANYNLLLNLFRYRPDDKKAMSECLRVIKESRLEVITDPRSRLSTRLGALLSYAGRHVIKTLAKLTR